MRIETIDTSPKRIGEDGHRRSVRVVIPGCNRSSNQDTCTVALEKVARHHLPVCQSRNAACIDRLGTISTGKGKNIRESSCLFGEVEVCRIREGSAVELIRLGVLEAPCRMTHHRPLTTCPVDHTQLMRIAYRQRLVQDAVDQTEDSRIGSNTQSE